MAAARKKGKKSGQPRDSKSTGKPVTAEKATRAAPERSGSAPREASQRRDIRPYVYAGFDAALAVVYAILFIKVFPSNHGSAQLLVYAMILAVVAMAAGMFVRNKWGWRIAVAGCASLLIIAVVVLVLLLVSAAFLAGVYGAFGQAASMVTLVAAALTIELIALVPALQMKFLMTRAGRRYFGREPLWR